jgi:hypothetical protein
VTAVTITERDTTALLELVHDGAAADGQEPFPPEVLHALSRLIPSDACVGYQEADVAGTFRVVELVEVIGEPIAPAAQAAYDTVGLQNPMHCRVQAHTHHALRLSDLLTRDQRRTLAWDALVWRVHGIDDSLRVWLPAAPGRSRSVYVERSGKNYTDRELTLFALLRPHLVRMQRNAEARRRFHAHKELTPREAEVLGDRRGQDERRDRAAALHLRAHGAQARRAHLREARRAHPDRRRTLRGGHLVQP